MSVLTNTVSAQVTVGFQGGEPGDTWGFTSTGADATALSERFQSLNKVTGSASLVVGGNTSGGSCIDGGSGNGTPTLRKFTFDPLDISSSSNSIRTFSINWGNRLPACTGTGWDAGEDLFFVAYFDGVAQPVATLAVGNNNAIFPISSNQYTMSIPVCVNTFSFEIYITTNRRDELLFIDDAKVTAPMLNAPVPGASAVSGDQSVCIGAVQTLNVAASPNTIYTWSGLPAGASFTSPNGTASSNTININWGTAAPGTYTISVTPSMQVCGTSASGASSSIVITVTAAPQITVSPNAASICSGQSVSLVASGATSYSWNNGLGNGAAVTASPSVTTTYTVTGSSGSCSSTATVTVTVNAVPSVSVTASAVSLCQGQTATLTASGAGAYVWQPAAGLSSTTGSVVTASPSSTTTYTVQGSSGGCTGTASQTITVIAPPQLTISQDLTICQGQFVTISASGASSFTWNNGLGAGSSHNVNPQVTTTYTVIGSNGSCSVTDSVTVTVSPSVNVSAISNPAIVCPGAPAVLTASGASSYTWSPATSLSAASGSTVTATPAATTTYTVTGTAGACSSTASVTVNVSAALNVTANASPASVCPGGVATLSASGATNYTWSPATGLSNISGASVTASPASTTTYTVTGTSGTCQGTAAITVTVNNNLSVNAGNDITVCEGSSVTLSGSGADTYTWDNGVVDGVTFVPVTTGVYTVVGVNTQGCTGTDQVMVTVESAPAATFSASAQSGCAPLNVQFITATQEGISFNWDFGDGSSAAVQDPQHVFYSSGCHDISLIVTSANGCSRTVSFQDYICIHPKPTASFMVNPTELSESDPTASFVNTSENAASYSWHFGDGTVSTDISPAHTYAVYDGGYEIILYAYNAEGCVDSARMTLQFSESPVYYVPNAFTPDGNELNQTFQPVFTAGYDPQRYHLEIYDRWGERIFESNDPALGWDGVSVAGTIVPDGVYVWKITFNLKNSDDRRVIKGHVALVR